MKRLACMDGLAGEIRAKADDVLKSRIAPKVAAWERTIAKSPVDDSRTVQLSVAAREPFADRFGRPHTARLWLRCVENTTALILDFADTFMADTGSFGVVTIRLDKGKAFEKRMTESTDHNALGLWNGGSAIPLIKSMFGKDAMLVRATPYSESPITVEFPVSGLEEAIGPLREACGW